MSGLESDNIGGFNSLIKNQKRIDGDVVVTTVLFDTHHTTFHNRIPFKEVPAMAEKDYVALGGIALLDAVGTTIDLLSKEITQQENKEYPSVIMIIITDGEENSSTDYLLKNIKKG